MIVIDTLQAIQNVVLTNVGRLIYCVDITPSFLRRKEPPFFNITYSIHYLQKSVVSIIWKISRHMIKEDNFHGML